MKSRFVALYYRDEDGIMRKVPGLEIMVSDGVAYQVYTLNYPQQKIILREL